ncbi:MAG TPA: histidine phosphatase family protein, partial [Blastocatellia bacterium]|nr:histidine phosphatase family protein [Blastocatellia bacterium]
MPTFYFIRHGQAGTRDNYDRLSDLGQEQARLLGKHLAESGTRLTAVYSGTMLRQQRTAELACAELARRGLFKGEPKIDARWNEFILASVYKCYGPRMAEEDAQFAADLREMQEVIKVDPHAAGGAPGRCDRAVILAWIANRYPDYDGESWSQFAARISSARESLMERQADEAIAVFTSATPISFMTMKALEMEDEKITRVAGVLYNSGITVMRTLREDLRLFTFNAAHHLPEEKRT